MVCVLYIESYTVFYHSVILPQPRLDLPPRLARWRLQGLPCGIDITKDIVIILGKVVFFIKEKDTKKKSHGGPNTEGQ